MSDKKPKDIELNIDFNNPNPMAMEITKMMLDNSLVTFGTNTQKATLTFIAIYSKVLFEIKRFEKEPQDLATLIKASFETLGK